MKEKKDELVSNELLVDIKNIIEQGRRTAYASVGSVMIETYWSIGKRILEEEQQGSVRAEYGEQLIDGLSKQLTREYGSGFSPRYLRAFRKFYIVVPDLKIWKSRFPNLQWTHIYRTLRVGSEIAIRWYLETASKEMWSVRTLDRNEQLFAAKYLPLLPTEEELRREIERQKEIFILQRQNN